MILNSQLLSKFALVRENSRLVNSQRPETPKLPIPPILPHIGLFSGIPLPDALLLCVLCELCGCNSIMQNKANVKMGKRTISTATLKAYANKQRTMNNKRHSKQTQSNPIFPPIFQNLPFRPGIYHRGFASPNFPASGIG